MIQSPATSALVLHSFRFFAPREYSDVVEGCTGETACATLVGQAVSPALCAFFSRRMSYLLFPGTLSGIVDCLATRPSFASWNEMWFNSNVCPMASSKPIFACV